MSKARVQFLEEVAGLAKAVSLDPIAGGQQHLNVDKSILILRRGILVAALITLETFIRDRTTELLSKLKYWPAQYSDLPESLRKASLLTALTNLYKYATMLKNQGEPYETELIHELRLMSSAQGPNYDFSKFIAGDYTGNISEASVKQLLAHFQIKDCWNSFHALSAEIGFGIPHIGEALKDIVGKRHRSAHSAGYMPAASDITELASKLLCLGLCFDVAMTASVQQAITQWKKWKDGECKWRDEIELIHTIPDGAKFRIKRQDYGRTYRVAKTESDVIKTISQIKTNKILVYIKSDTAKIPISWDIIKN